MTETQTQSKTNWFLVLLFLVTCMGLVFVISWYYLIHSSLRLDEAQSLWQTSFSISGMLSQVSQDVHVPLYHIFLHFWNLVGGTNPVRDRLLSLFFFELSIPALFILTRKYFGNRIAVFTTLIFSLSAFMNWFGNEIRMYSLLVLLTILSHSAFLELIKKGNFRNWLWYGVISVLGIFTHYYFAFVLVTQALFFLINRKQFPRKSFSKFVVTGTIVVAAISIWGFYFLQQGFGSNTRPQLGKPSTVDFFNAFVNFVFGFFANNTILESLWPVLILLIFLYVGSRKQLSLIPQYFLLQVAVPMVLAFAVSNLVIPIFLSRYLIIVIPALYILFNWYISCFNGLLNSILQAGLVGVVVVSLMYMILVPDLPVSENYQQVAEYLQANVNPDEVIALSAPFTLYPIEYYYNGPATVTTIPFWDTLKHGQIPPYTDNAFSAQLDTMSQNYQAIWVVLSYDQGYQDKIKSFLDHHYAMTDNVVFPDQIGVYEYQFKY